MEEVWSLDNLYIGGASLSNQEDCSDGSVVGMLWWWCGGCGGVVVVVWWLWWCCGGVVVVVGVL